MTIDNSKDDKLQIAFEDPISKIKFYCLKNALELPAKRGVLAMKAKRFAEMKIDEESLKGLMQKVKTAVNTNQDFVEAMGWWQQIEFRLNMICEEKSILDLVSLYYYLEDESPDEPSKEANERKRKIFDEHPIVKGFFLRIGINMMNNFSMQHDEAVLSYLAETKKVTDQLTTMLEASEQ
jgi:hypothetical protein